MAKENVFYININFAYTVQTLFGQTTKRHKLLALSKQLRRGYWKYTQVPLLYFCQEIDKDDRKHKSYYYCYSMVSGARPTN
jgi:hypothetical protein